MVSCALQPVICGCLGIWHCCCSCTRGRRMAWPSPRFSVTMCAETVSHPHSKCSSPLLFLLPAVLHWSTHLLSPSFLPSFLLLLHPYLYSVCCLLTGSFPIPYIASPLKNYSQLKLLQPTSIFSPIFFDTWIVLFFWGGNILPSIFLFNHSFSNQQQPWCWWSLPHWWLSTLHNLILIICLSSHIRDWNIPCVKITSRQSMWTW